MSILDPTEQLNSVKYLYLCDLAEPRDNSIKIIVEEAVLNEGREVQTPILKDVKSHPIESIPGCKKFELYWKLYIAYCVTEEAAGSMARNGYDDESYTGNVLRFYTKSHFLDHIQRDTGGHGKAVQHYKILCLNHLIDVAAYEPPQVRLLAS